jgi:endonuclease/exonuclease/phosphatase family metal-dependent hydrolase
MALLYQHESGPRVRGTLSAYFLIGIMMSLVGLHLVGRFGWVELIHTAVLLPGTLLGYALSRRTAAWLDRGYTRAGILALATLTGLMVIAQHTIAATRDDGRLRVATYNIRHGRGMDSVVNLDRTAAVLAQLDADVIGLQEVDRLVERSGRVDQAEALGRSLGMQHAFGAFMPHQGGEYGMAILSRFPIERVHRLALPDGNEPRVALMVEVELPAGDRIVVINVHFDWVQDDTFRFAQASALRAVLDTLSLPYLVVGDFNDVPTSRTLGLLGDLARASQPAVNRQTFPSGAPEREIDYVRAGPAAMWSVTGGEVIPETVASDHRPVRAVVRLSPPSGSLGPARRP